ncbi:MAG: hypothetical protein RBR63_02980 [Methanosarcina vacuolata]|nr:hypothetical protein [Methanosarcina vacuolata]
MQQPELSAALHDTNFGFLDNKTASRQPGFREIVFGPDTGPLIDA